MSGGMYQLDGGRVVGGGGIIKSTKAALSSTANPSTGTPAVSTNVAKLYSSNGSAQHAAAAKHAAVVAHLTGMSIICKTFSVAAYTCILVNIFGRGPLQYLFFTSTTSCDQSTASDKSSIGIFNSKKWRSNRKWCNVKRFIGYGPSSSRRSIPKTAKCDATSHRKNGSNIHNGSSIGHHHSFHRSFWKPTNIRCNFRAARTIARKFTKSIHLHNMQQFISKPLSSCLLPYFLRGLSQR